MPVASTIVGRRAFMVMFSQRFETRHTVTVMMMWHHNRKQHDDTCHQHYVTDYMFLRSHDLCCKSKKFILQLKGKQQIYRKKKTGRESPPSRTVVHGISISGLLILIIQANVWLGQ